MLMWGLWMLYFDCSISSMKQKPRSSAEKKDGGGDIEDAKREQTLMCESQ